MPVLLYVSNRQQPVYQHELSLYTNGLPIKAPKTFNILFTFYLICQTNDDAISVALYHRLSSEGAQLVLSPAGLLLISPFCVSEPTTSSCGIVSSVDDRSCILLDKQRSCKIQHRNGQTSAVESESVINKGENH